MKNIVLVGMPGAGKSTIGVVAAKALGYNFIDSDLLIQAEGGDILEHLIKKRGIDGFLALENRVNRDIDARRTVIATGGSAVYGDRAMARLCEQSTVVYLSVAYDTLASRLQNIRQRGVVLSEGQTLRMLYEERVPLYERYADVTVEEQGKSAEDIVSELAAMFTDFGRR
jgi:shikimate kinase